MITIKSISHQVARGPKPRGCRVKPAHTSISLLSLTLARFDRLAFPARRGRSNPGPRAMASDNECYYDDDGEEEEEGMEVDEDDVGLLEESSPLPERRADYWAFTKESLSAVQQQDLAMAMNLLNIKRHNARALLIHHRWKMDRMYDSLERKGREGLLRETGIVLQENNSVAAPGSMTPSASVTCNVCFEDFSQMSAASTMECGHWFCNDCWTEYFFASLDSGNRQIRCMEVKCSAICDDAIVRSLLGRRYPEAAKRFDDFLLESYLEGNDSVKWCPSAPHCGRAIRVEAGERYCEVECPCGVGFCFNCAALAHSPCPCTMWEKWDAKLRGESENLKWIVEHTKSCPNCFKPIEKNGGCNHVVCRCGQHLCYACGGASGAGHSCNRYMEEEKKMNVDSGWRQMRRYTHYCDRFKMHEHSYMVELKKLWPAVQKRMGLLQSSDHIRRPLMKDAAWLAWVHRSLLGSRQVLSRSFAFAYYMFGSEVRTYPAERTNLAMAQNLFEDQQEQLERNVERLSKVLATDMPALTEEEMLRTMQEAVNLARIVETHCREMYTVIQDELLPLLVDPMNIATYRPDGPDKAKEFAA